MGDQNEPEQAPRKRRKLYGEPDNSFMNVPRSTHWRKSTNADPANDQPQAQAVNVSSSSGSSSDSNEESEHELGEEQDRDQMQSEASSSNDSPRKSSRGLHSEQDSSGASENNDGQSEREGPYSQSSDNSLSNDEGDVTHNRPESRGSCGEEPELGLEPSEDSRRGAVHHQPQARYYESVREGDVTHNRPEPPGSCGEEPGLELEPSEVSRRCAVHHQPQAHYNESVREDSEESQDDDDDDVGDQHPFEEGDDLRWGDVVSTDESGDEEELQQLPLPQEQELQHPPNRQLQHLIPSHEFLKTQLQGPYSERIDNAVVASRGEILLNIQEYFRQHPGPLTAQEDLHRLVNSIFYQEIIPDSSYKIDKLYASPNNIRYYFYCSKCFECFGELDNKQVRTHICPMCHATNIVHDLTKASFFIIIDFLPQLQLLLDGHDVASKFRSPKDLQSNSEIINDLYDGEMYREFVASLDFTQNNFYMSLTGCTDGTPLFESSTMSIWPIFVMVNELPPHIRMSNILLSGLWFGRHHPKMELFLEPFSNYIRNLSVEGFNMTVLGEIRNYKAFLIAFCVDSGARGPIQCVHCHNGASPCNWCLHPGQAEGGGSNARKFPQLPVEPPSRTVEHMITDGRAVLLLPGDGNHINGVTGISPLMRCPKFDIVRGMVLDNLHWASFGIARHMGQLWLGETKKKAKKKDKNDQNQERNVMPPYYVGTDETKIIINKRINQIRPPLEVRRLPRDLSQLHEYNAREWENFALYYSVPLFKNILPERFLRHWTKFVEAFYLFMKTPVKRTDYKVAGEFMKDYVNDVEDLYGIKEMSFNMHISNHAEDNAVRWGNGSRISAYAFENGNKILKAKIHAERGIPHQVIRSLGRDSSLKVLRSMANTPQATAYRTRIERKEVKKCIFAGSVRCMMPRGFTPSVEEAWLCEQQNIDISQVSECRRIIVQNVCYGIDTGAKTDNSYALCGENIVKIRKIIVNELTSAVHLFVSRVRCTPYPLPRCSTSRNFPVFMYTVDLVEQGIAIVSSESLVTICVHINIDCPFYKGNFVSIMANTANVF